MMLNMRMCITIGCYCLLDDLLKLSVERDFPPMYCHMLCMQFARLELELQHCSTLHILACLHTAMWMSLLEVMQLMI